MMPKNTNRQNFLTDQYGLASILVTMVMMIVISLIVLGFATIANRTQRESLDRQLSNQAFYAAETGVNDAVNYVRANITTIGTTQKTQCGPTSGSDPYAGLSAPTYDPALSTTDGGVSYTCLLVNPAPITAKYQSVGDNSIVAPIVSGGTPSNPNAPITSIKLTWSAPPNVSTMASGCPGSVNGNILPASASWYANCTFGVGRVDLVPVTTNFTRSSLDANTMSAFFVPTNGVAGSGSQLYTTDSSGSQPAIYPAQCTNTCTETISGLNGKQYDLRILFIYNEAGTLEINAFNGSTPVGITGDEIEVDATGKANDVLRRIQVYVPVIQPPNAPDYAVQTTNSLCKQFSITNAASPTPVSGPDASRDSDSDCKNFGY